jgi:hypothetical protein
MIERRSGAVRASPSELSEKPCSNRFRRAAAMGKMEVESGVVQAVRGGCHRRAGRWWRRQRRVEVRVSGGDDDEELHRGLRL